MHGFCIDCDHPLLPIEALMYEYRCERCELLLLVEMELLFRRELRGQPMVAY